VKLLTIDGGKLVVKDMGDGGIVVAVLNSVGDFNIAAKANLMVSSTVDFPEEYTDDPAVIALARAIRN